MNPFALSRSLLLVALCLGAGKTAGADERAPPSKTSSRPNIILLLTDDQVDRATGCYGNKQVKTPNVDQLGADGIIFNNHYNTTSICMASRATIMTGQYEYKTGCNFMHGDLMQAAFVQSYPVLLRKAGYYTGFAGKIGFLIKGKKFAAFAAHFDAWAGGPGQTKYQTAQNKGIAKYAKKYPHSSRAYGAWAGDFIRSAKKSGKPFCLSISFKAPHLPFTPDPEFDHVYEKTIFRKPANYGKDNAKHLAPQAKTGRQFKRYRFWTDSDAAYQKSMRTYNQLIYGVDVAIGMIRQALREEKLAESTVIIFTSDNGYSCGAHGFGGKVLPYEEASRSPLIVYDPRQPKRERGQRRDTVTANIDVMPTILDLAGVTPPKHVDGVSLLPLLRKPKAISREAVSIMNLWGNDEIQELAVVTKDWKYVYWYYQSKAMAPTEELFNVGKDRLEMTNLATSPKHAKTLETMRSLYDERFRHLRENAVNYHGYAKYGLLFDRNLPWERKAPLLRRRGQ